MKKKLSKVLAVVLSLAMVLGLAAVDTTSVGQAAKKLKFTKTGKQAVKSGQKRTLKISGTKAKKAKWTVTGTGKQYIKLAKKKGKTNSFTVKANATGKAKITAKLTKKNKVSVTYTLSCDLEGIAFDEASATATVETGATANLKLVGVPSNAAVPTTATYAVWMDAEKKTAVPETTTVTAAAVEGGVDFTASVAGTYYVVAAAGDFEATAVVTVKDHVAVLKEAKQTKLNELELTFDSDCTYIKNTDDIKIVDNGGTGVRHDVKTITFDKDDKTKAIVTVLVDIKDGKDDTVEYAGSVVNFKASDGKVAKIALNKSEAPITTNVEISALFTDANGVIVKEVKYGDYSDDRVQITAEPTGEATVDEVGHVIRMEKLTDTVKVTAIFRSGAIDSVTGEPEKIEQDFVITAINAGQITGVTEFTIITDTQKEDQKYTELGADQKKIDFIKVSVDPNATKTLYALVKDDLGYNRVDGSLTAAGYVLSSSDDTYLQVNGDKLQGNREGKASVLVSDENGNVLFTIPVTVKAAPRLEGFTTNKTSVQLSAGNKKLPLSKTSSDVDANWTPDSDTVKVMPVDQYGDFYPDVAIDVYASSTAKNNREQYNRWHPAAQADKAYDVKVEVNGRLPVGEYDADTKPMYFAEGGTQNNTYTIEVKDKVFDTTKTKTLYVTTRQPKYGSVNKIKLEAEAATVDTALGKVDSNNAKGTVSVKVALLDTNGVFVAYDYVAATKNAISITKGTKTYGAADNYVMNDNLTLGTTSTAAKKVTLGAIWVGNNKATGTDKSDELQFVYRSYTTASGYSVSVTGSDQDDSLNVVTKAEANRYTVKVANIELYQATNKTQDFFASSAATASCVTLGAAKTSIITTSIKVEDSQATPKLTQLEKSMSSLTLGNALSKAFKVECTDTETGNKTYDPSKHTASDPTGKYVLAPVKKGYVVNDKGVSFTKIKVYVPYPNTDGTLYVEHELAAPYAVKAE